MQNKKISEENVGILIPTYNESKNLENIIKKISAVSKKFNILIIDDNSQDGTIHLLNKLKKKYNLRYYIRKNERGYGSAIKFGFEKLIVDKKIKTIITMDGDLSHDPRDIFTLLQKINLGNDIVIGSRYVKGGETKNWSILRKITSKLTNILTRNLLNTGINDNTSGFRAYRVEVIKKIIGNLESKGYFILEEILFKIKKEISNFDYKIFEIPISFKNREHGKSKAKMIKEAIGLLKLILKLRKKEIMIFLKYCIVGFFGIFVNELSLFLFTEKLGIYYLFSGMMAIELSILFNFIFDDLWTFKDRKHKNKKYFDRMYRFNIARIFTAGINFLFLFGLTTLGINYLISNLIGIIISTLLGFKLSTKWVWKK